MKGCVVEQNKWHLRCIARPPNRRRLSRNPHYYEKKPTFYTYASFVLLAFLTGPLSSLSNYNVGTSNTSPL